MLIAAYARAATRFVAESDVQIDSQLRRIRGWAKEQGHLVVREYVDAGASGADINRQQLQQMIHDSGIDAPPFEAIVVDQIFRLARDFTVLSTLERLFYDRDVKVIAIYDNSSHCSNDIQQIHQED